MLFDLLVFGSSGNDAEMLQGFFSGKILDYVVPVRKFEGYKRNLIKHLGEISPIV